MHARVVKRIIPEPGTLGAYVSFIETHVPTDSVRDEIMEKSINERSTAKADPWESAALSQNQGSAG